VKNLGISHGDNGDYTRFPVPVPSSYHTAEPVSHPRRDFLIIARASILARESGKLTTLLSARRIRPCTSRI